MFDKAEDRDELLDKLIAAISPSTVIESPPGLPHTWSELARMAPIPKYTLEGEEYATKAEYDQALDALLRKREQERAKEASNSKGTPPSEKPPRKPYTRKPRE